MPTKNRGEREEIILQADDLVVRGLKKTHLRMKPCGADCWCRFLGQPFIVFSASRAASHLSKIILAEQLEHAVHLVVAEPATVPRQAIRSHQFRLE